MNFDGNLMEIFMMDSMGWPYDSFDCLSFLLEGSTKVDVNASRLTKTTGPQQRHFRRHDIASLLSRGVSTGTLSPVPPQSCGRLVIMPRLSVM